MAYMKTDMLRVGFFQFAPKFGEVATNLSKIVSALRGSEADIIVLPELAFTGYFFQVVNCFQPDCIVSRL